MQINLHRRSRLEGFLGPFFLVQLVFWLHALSGPGVHGGAGHHEASWRHRTSRGFTRLHGIPRGSSAARRPLCATGASLSGRALWPGDLRASAASAQAL